MVGAGAVVLALWLATGVTAWEAVRWLGYWLAWIVVPGWLAYRALWPRVDDALRQFVFGWGLGYVLFGGAFAALSALGLRDGIFAYPAVILPLFALARLRGPLLAAPGEDTTASSRVWVLGLAGVVVAIVVLVLLPRFLITPLPGTVSALDWTDDTTFFLSLVGEAKWQWPMTAPNVVGQPLDYHLLAFFSPAASSRITGVDAGTTFLRLDLTAYILLATMTLALLGRALGGVRTGIAAALVVPLATELDLDLINPTTLGNQFLGHFFHSETFLLGLALFLLGVLLVLDLVVDRTVTGRGPWILFGVLLAGMGASKGTTLPVLGGALILFGAYRLLIFRSPPWRAVGAAALAFGVLAVLLKVQYKGETGNWVLDPFELVDGRVGTRALWMLSGLPVIPFLVAAFSAIAALVVGVLALLVRRRGRLEPRQVWMLCPLVAALPVALTLLGPGSAQEYFFLYGYPPAATLGACGLVTVLWPDDGARVRMRVVGIAALVVAVSVAAAAVGAYELGSLRSVLPGIINLRSNHGGPMVGIGVLLPALAALGALVLAGSLRGGRRRVVLVAGGVAAAAGTAFALLLLGVYGAQHGLDAVTDGGAAAVSGSRMKVLAAAVVVAGVVGVVLAYVRAAARARPSAAAQVALVAVVLAGVTGTFLDGFLSRSDDTPTSVWERLADGDPPYSQQNRNLTRGIDQGLVWVREHSAPDEVIAVNNQARTPTGSPAYFYYSARSERRVFLEGWQFGAWGAGAGPVPDADEVETVDPSRYPVSRYRLNQAAFAGNPAAIRRLATRYGVAFMVVDRIHGKEAPGLARRARRVYANSDVTVYRIAAPA